MTNNVYSIDVLQQCETQYRACQAACAAIAHSDDDPWDFERNRKIREIQRQTSYAIQLILARG